MESFSNVQEAIRVSILKSIANYKKTPKDRLTVSYVETRLETLEQHWQIFFQTHIEIVKTVNQPELLSSDYHNNDVYEDVEELYVDHKSLLKEQLANLKKTSDLTCSSETRQPKVSFKLPEIKIPFFSGDYMEWYSFKELYTGLIHNNELLDYTQKLYYLKSYLTGDAAELLKNIAITADNYISSWEKLESMYDNKRFIVNNYLKRLFNQKTMCTESAQGIKNLISNSSDCLESIKNLGVDVSSWDILIIHVISGKLDKETKKAWELSVSSDTTDKLPTYSQFTNFLTARFRGLENIDNRTQTERVSKSVEMNHIQSFHVFSGTQETPKNVSKCFYCKSDHKIDQCKLYLHESNSNRRKFARDSGLCFICLCNDHTAKVCTMHFRCHLCKKRHHTLLHPSGKDQFVGKTLPMGDDIKAVGHTEKSFSAFTTCDKICRYGLPFRDGDHSRIKSCGNSRISETESENENNEFECMKVKHPYLLKVARKNKNYN